MLHHPSSYTFLQCCSTFLVLLQVVHFILPILLYLHSLILDYLSHICLKNEKTLVLRYFLPFQVHLTETALGIQDHKSSRGSYQTNSKMMNSKMNQTERRSILADLDETINHFQVFSNHGWFQRVKKTSTSQMCLGFITFVFFVEQSGIKM